MRNFIVAIVLVLTVSSGRGQSRDSSVTVGFYFGSNLLTDVGDICFSPSKYDGEIYGYQALPTDKFDANNSLKKVKPNLDIGIVWNAPWNEHSTVQVGLGFAQTSFRLTDGRCLRYTDMVVEGSGYVAPSYYQLKELRSTNRYLYLRPRFMLQAKSSKIKHRLGVGAWIYWLAKTNVDYEFTGPNDDLYYYEQDDLRFNDYVFTRSLEFLYQVQIAETASHRIWLNTAVTARAVQFTNLTSQNQYNRTVQHSLWSIGLLIE